jgi:hypothetical protein
MFLLDGLGEKPGIIFSGHYSQLRIKNFFSTLISNNRFFFSNYTCDDIAQLWVI